MLKGAQKRMIVIRTRDSRLFEEAYFVMRRDLPDGDAHRSDMLWEANRIVERSLGVPTATADRASAPPKPSCKRWLIHALTFTAGLLSGGLLAFLLTLWL